MRKNPLLHIVPIEDYFEQIVDSIRQTGTITNITTGGGSSVITTDNNLNKDDVISVGGIECRVDEASDTKITVNKEVDTGSTSWKASFPYFMDGHVAEISKRLSEKDVSDDSVLKYTKYPLVVLYQDVEFSVSKTESQTTSVDLAIVNKTNNDYITEQRREFNFESILDPIYNDLIDAINNSSTLNLVRENKFNPSRKYFWGSIDRDKNPFNDFLDAIEVRGLQLEIQSLNC